MKTKKLPAIVLRRTNFGEADRIVNFITPDGKISAIARGARRQKSKLAGGIEIFALNEVVFAQGKSDLQTVVSARMKEFYRDILKDFSRTDFAYRAIKTTAKYSENVDNDDFFNILLTTLQSLADLELNLILVSSWFYLRMFMAVGNQLNLSSDLNGEKLTADQTYSFDGLDKAFVPALNGKYGADHIKLLRFLAVSEPKSVARVKNLASLLSDLDEISRILEEL